MWFTGLVRPFGIFSATKENVTDRLKHPRGGTNECTCGYDVAHQKYRKGNIDTDYCGYRA
jgi:hypothetical protein